MHLGYSDAKVALFCHLSSVEIFRDTLSKVGILSMGVLQAHCVIYTQAAARWVRTKVMRKSLLHESTGIVRTTMVVVSYIFLQIDRIECTEDFFVNVMSLLVQQIFHVL